MKDDMVLYTVTENDYKDLLIWRNHPEVRKNFFNKEIVSWEEHRKWLHSKIKSNNTRIYIARLGKNKIGVIRFEIENMSVKVNVNLNPDYFGKGLGTKIIKLGSEKFISETKTKKPIVAEIKKDNIASQKTFAKSGYRLTNQMPDKLIYTRG